MGPNGTEKFSREESQGHGPVNVMNTGPHWIRAGRFGPLVCSLVRFSHNFSLISQLKCEEIQNLTDTATGVVSFAEHPKTHLPNSSNWAQHLRCFWWNTMRHLKTRNPGLGFHSLWSEVQREAGQYTAREPGLNQDFAHGLQGITRCCSQLPKMGQQIDGTTETTEIN